VVFFLFGGVFPVMIRRPIDFTQSQFRRSFG
jgi:hypothetical protein